MDHRGTVSTAGSVVRAQVASTAIAENMERNIGQLLEIAEKLSLRSSTLAARLVGAEPEGERDAGRPATSGWLYIIDERLDEAHRFLRGVEHDIGRIENALGSV